MTTLSVNIPMNLKVELGHQRQATLSAESPVRGTSTVVRENLVATKEDFDDPNYYDQLQGGMMISVPSKGTDTSVGTLGLVFPPDERRDPPRPATFITAFHLLPNSGMFDEVYQPYEGYNEGFDRGRRVGALLKGGLSQQYGDSVLCEVGAHIENSPLSMLDLGQIVPGDYTAGSAKACVGELLQKRGARTGVTSGYLLSNSWKEPIFSQDPTLGGWNSAMFIGSVNGPFSLGGDSGAVVLNAKKQAVGLLIRGSNSPIELTEKVQVGPTLTDRFWVTIALPIGHILEAFDVSIA